MPLDFESYAGIVLPFVAYRGPERREVDGPSEAYRSFGLSLPGSLTLDQLYDEFQVIEGSKAIPAGVRAVLDRFAGTATAVFVKSSPYGRDDAAYWTIERELFLALARSRRYLTLEYPRREAFTQSSLVAAWYMHHPGDAPILYIADSSDLVAALSRVLDDRLVRLTLSDKYHT